MRLVSLNAVEKLRKFSERVRLPSRSRASLANVFTNNGWASTGDPFEPTGQNRKPTPSLIWYTSLLLVLVPKLTPPLPSIAMLAGST